MAERGELGRGLRVLDLGCGAGEEAVFFARQGCRVTAVDSSREALALAGRAAAHAGLEVELRCESALRLGCAAGSFDLVHDRGCLHGIEPDDRPAYVESVHRVLCPGGRLLLRGALHDDPERSLFGLGEAELDRLFDRRRFQRGRVSSLPMAAPAGDLEAVLVIVEKLDRGEGVESGI